METSCSTLIKTFDKIGGKIIFNYETKQCTYYPPKIVSNIESKDSVNIDSLLMNFAYVNYKFVEYIPLKNKINIEPLHIYQEPLTKGFIIKSFVDKNGVKDELLEKTDDY